MDYYNTLGVPRDADQDTIKRAYRKLAMQHHPDRGGDPNEFQKISEAYETLSDTDKRFRYDNPQARQQHFQGFPGDFNFTHNGFDLNDLFGQIFGQRQNFHRNMRPTYRTTVTVSLVDAYNGIDHVLQLNLPNGNKVINITIPKGIESGQQMRFDNVIDDATLIVEFHVLKDLRFDRHGPDLYANYPISVLDLIVGAKVPFQTISGKMLDVTIPAGTQPTHQIRLPSLGMPIGNTGQFGDQILLLKPFVPDNIHTDIIDSIKRNQSK